MAKVSRMSNGCCTEAYVTCCFAPQFKLEDMVEDINESHVTHWTQMLSASTPPVINTPFTAYMDLYQLKRHVVAFNAQKLKEVVGYQLRRPVINQETVKELVDKLTAEGTWPNVEPKSS